MDKKYIYSLGINGILLLFALFLAIAYGIYLSQKDNSKISITESGCINIVYSDNKKISLKNPKPLSNEDGMTSTANTITLTNNCKNNQNVELDLDVLSKSTIDDSKMHIYINGEYELGPTILSDLRYAKGEKSVERTYQLIQIDMKPNDTKRINLRLWLDENVPMQNDKAAFYAEYYIKTGDDTIKPNFKETLLKKHKVIKETEGFQYISTTDDGFLDVDGSYYLRGRNEENYVSFANHTWRILGITKDDNVKLIYADGDLSSNYSDISNNQDSLSYKDSNIKKLLDDWYKDNLKEFDDYIVKTKYCNDLTNEAVQRVEYGSYKRVFNDNTPSLNCSNDDEIESKIGLLTLDEANYAGGSTKDNNNQYYLYDGKDYFTMSPAFMASQAWIGTVTAYGKIDATPVNMVKEVRPVITLESYVNVSGDGNYNNPYTINEY